MPDPDGDLPKAVYQAQGIVSVQAKCSLDRALAFMQEMAEATDSPLQEIAEEIISGHVHFRPRN
jgi:AmiR/NasT family two-component response regulator